jgi:transposase-like protein
MKNLSCPRCLRGNVRMLRSIPVHETDGATYRCMDCGNTFTNRESFELEETVAEKSSDTGQSSGRVVGLDDSWARRPM